MPVQWGLAGESLNGLEALKYYGQAQQDQLVQQKLAIAEQQRAALAGAYNPQTGQADNQRISQVLLQSGDIDGYRQYNKQLQGEQAEAAKTIGRLARYADSPEKWDRAIDWAIANGAPELAAYKGQYSPENRMAALAIGGEYDAFVRENEPRYIAVGENGVVNTRDPQALAAVAAATGGGARSAPPQPGQSLEEKAQAAIARGADPVRVRERLHQMQGGAGGGQRSFP